MQVHAPVWIFLELRSFIVLCIDLKDSQIQSLRADTLMFGSDCPVYLSAFRMGPGSQAGGLVGLVGQVGNGIGRVGGHFTADALPGPGNCIGSALNSCLARDQYVTLQA